MRRLTPEVQSPRLRPWHARTPYAVAGLLILMMSFGVALEVVQRNRRGGSRQQLTETEIRDFANAFPQWAKANPERTCPADLVELAPWTGHRDSLDIWGSQYQWACFRWGSGWRLNAWSLGEDQILGTPDDVWTLR
jgi:hypothetical protein